MNNMKNVSQQRALVITKTSHILSCICKARTSRLRKGILLLCLVFVRVHLEYKNTHGQQEDTKMVRDWSTSQEERLEEHVFSD